MPAPDGSGASLPRTLKRLVLVALGTLVILVVLDLVLVRGPRPARELLENDVAWRIVWFLATCGAGTGFFITLLHHAGDSSEPGIVKPALLSVALAGLWFALALIAVGNFHLAIGGGL